jgi:hypothetical protein
MLGLWPIAWMNTLVLDPDLPGWMPEIVLRNLRVGDASVTLRFWRKDSGDSTWEVLHQERSLHIVRQPAPESLTAGWTDRAGAMLESMVK